MAKRLPHCHDAGGIEAIGRLVEEEERWIVEERACNAEALLHPERVPRDLVARTFAQADDLEDFVDAPNLRGGAAGREGSQVVSTGQVWIERGRLHERTDVEESMPIATRERPTEQLDRAPVGMDQPCQNPHGRGLARPVRAEEAVHDARRDSQVETVERESRPVALPESARREREIRARHRVWRPEARCRVGTGLTIKISSLQGRLRPLRHESVH